MASGALINSAPAFAVAATSKDIPAMVDTRWTAGGLPLLQSEVQQQQQQQRPWIPADGRDAFISWLRAEFAAANAIIDSMCHHLQLIGKPGEYDFVLACIQQRRSNWNAVLHMQQYFSVAEVIFALQQVVLRKQQMQTFDRSNLYLPQASSPTIAEDRNVIHKTNVQRTNQIHAPPVINSMHQNSTANGRDYHRNASVNEEPEQINRVGESNEEFTRESLKQQVFDGSHVDAQSSPLETQEPSTSDSGIPLGRQECKGDAHQTSATKEEFEDEKTPQISAEKIEDLSATLASKLSNGGNHILKEQKDAQTEKKKVILEGVELFESVFDKANSSQVVSSLYELEHVSSGGKLGGCRFVAPKKWMKTKGKRNIQFGSVECSEDGECNAKGVGDEGTEPMPPFLQQTLEDLIHRDILPSSKRPDCCTVIVLDEEKHLSSYFMYYDLEKPLYMLNLVSDCTIVFERNPKIEVPGETVNTFKLILSVGSILVVKGDGANFVKAMFSGSSMKPVLLLLGKLKSTKFPKVAQLSSSSLNSAQSPATVACTSSASTGHAGLFKLSGPIPRPTNFLPPPLSYPSVSIPMVSRPPPPHVSTQYAQSLASGSVGGQVGPYPSMTITNTSWTPIPGPVRVHANGTGVFLPSSGMPSSVVQPNSSLQIRQVFVPIPPLQKTTSSPAALSSLDSPESNNYSKHSRSKTRNSALEGAIEQSISTRSLTKKDLGKGSADGKLRLDSQKPAEVQFKGACDGHPNSGHGNSSHPDD